MFEPIIGLLISNISSTCHSHTHPLLRYIKFKPSKNCLFAISSHHIESPRSVPSFHVLFRPFKQRSDYFYKLDINDREQCLRQLSESSSCTPLLRVIGTVLQGYETFGNFTSSDATSPHIHNIQNMFNIVSVD